MLSLGLKAGDLTAEGQAIAKLIEAGLFTGRPLATSDWIEQQEAALARPLAPQKPGPKPKNADTGR